MSTLKKEESIAWKVNPQESWDNALHYQLLLS